MKFLRAHDKIDMRQILSSDSPRAWAMQPRKPNTTCGRSFAMRPSIPIFPSAFWSAMSRTLQVFKSTTSASVSWSRARSRA